jgi:hypothetical protein
MSFRSACVLIWLTACGTLPTTGGDGGGIEAGVDAPTSNDAQVDVANPVDASTQDAIVDVAIVDVYDGGTTAIATGQSNVSSIAIDSTNIYWTTTSTIESCPIDNCTTPTPLHTGASSPGPIATDGVNVYVQEGFYLFKCAVGGCANTPTQLASIGNFGSSIVTDGTNVYFADGLPSIESCAVGGCNNAPTEIAGGVGYAAALAISGTNSLLKKSPSRIDMEIAV